MASARGEYYGALLTEVQRFRGSAVQRVRADFLLLLYKTRREPDGKGAAKENLINYYISRIIGPLVRGTRAFQPLRNEKEKERKKK
jgi:hypothetical protein